MLGIHLHETGQGDMDYSVIMPLIKPLLITILEVHSKVKREEPVKGIHFIKGLLYKNADKAGLWHCREQPEW